ncbi:MAG: TRAP transporter substrate-binding protein [Clostridiales bacterium]|jgi:tripartite ATP-independent transporter DctP family solute receptor|nr:TRAP transporter substrate-binding protein [Clostridiales bacterium]
MKKRLFALPILVLALFIIGACGDNGGGAEAITLRLSEVHSGADHPANVGHLEFARLANERSDGFFNVEVHYGGTLGSEMEVMAQVQMGTVEMIRLPVPVIANVDDRFNALFLPGVWDGRDPMFRALDGVIGEYFAEILREHDMYILAWHDAGARSLYNSVRPIYTPEDLAGLRIRMQEAPLMIRLMELMGGVPVPMGPAEVYTAIQTGLVDGAENNWPSFVTSFSHHEVAPFFTENEHSRAPEAVIINLGVWEGLTQAQQDILRQAAIEGAVAQREAWARVELEAEAEAIASGVQVTRLTPEQLQAFTDRIMPIWDDFPELIDLIYMIRDAQ